MTYYASGSKTHKVAFNQSCKNVVAQKMLDLLRQDVIWKTSDANIERLLDTDDACNRLADTLLTWRTFISPIATFMR